MLHAVGLSTERAAPAFWAVSSEPLSPFRPCDSVPIGRFTPPLSLRPGKHPAGRHALPRRRAVGKKLYVGNLTYGVRESDLEALFGQFGTVQSAQIIQDRETGRSKGFGFV